MNTEFCTENVMGGHLLEHPGVDGRIILKRIIEKSAVKAWTVKWFEIGFSGGLCEHSCVPVSYSKKSCVKNL
jgi:hypothetical protein